MTQPQQHTTHSPKGSDETRPSDRNRIDPDSAADAAPSTLREGDDLAARQDQLLDEALEETFPSSDPISPKRIT